MYKWIYDNFKHWYHGGTIWFYSDPHFADEEMKKRKNYINDDEQVKSINKVIGKNDTIIFLGDVGDVSYIKKIRGYKILIMGNHDTGATNYINIFNEVYEGPLFISKKILISHEPIDCLYALNIHGHDHSCRYRSYKSLNVCAENINYTPVSINQIIKSGLLSEIIDIHRATIDKRL